MSHVACGARLALGERARKANNKDPAWAGARRPATDTVLPARPGNGEGICSSDMSEAEG